MLSNIQSAFPPLDIGEKRINGITNFKSIDTINFYYLLCKLLWLFLQKLFFKVFLDFELHL
ncbi:hypothetical protein NSTCB13_02477 [Nostoc sp. DSM 114160]|jgi:hypothetical protein